MNLNRLYDQASAVSHEFSLQSDSFLNLGKATATYFIILLRIDINQYPISKSDMSSPKVYFISLKLR